MSFPWTKKMNKVIPAQQVIVVEKKPVTEAEVEQVVVLPVVDDKISVIEHKNGEQVVIAREEDDEAHEVKGDLCQGQGIGPSDQGSKEDMEEARRG